MKPIWSGAISFGMVNIPVNLYSAIERKRPVEFKLLHAKDHAPIKYKRWCEEHDEEVPWEEVVRGVDVGDGSYYIFTHEELEELRPERSKTIEIEEFIDSEQIDQIYLDKHYFVGPDSAGEKPYFLFREALYATKKAAVGKFVMREREYVCSIQPYGNAMLLSTLNYAYELRDVNEVDHIQDMPAIKEKELDLAEQLVEKLSVDDFDIFMFKDSYAQKLKEAIEHKELVEVKVSEPGTGPTSEKDLIAALKASLKT